MQRLRQKDLDTICGMFSAKNMPKMSKNQSLQNDFI